MNNRTSSATATGFATAGNRPFSYSLQSQESAPLLRLFDQMDEAAALDALSESYYHQLTRKERKRLFDGVSRLPFFTLKNEACRFFAARFNPKNQYKLKVRFNGAEETIECFKYNGKFHTGKQLVINEKYVAEVLWLYEAN